MYERLTKYVGTLADRETSSRFGCGTIGMDDFYGTEGFTDTGYFSTLERHGVDTSKGIESCDVEHADLDLVRACVTWCARGDRFCDGYLGAHAKSGFLDHCLTRLKELDEG